MTTLSIIVPTLNEAGGIVAHLMALQALRTRGAEVIVVDGGSTDGTPALAAPWSDVVHTGNRGRAAQMNAGAGRARGTVLLFLHADTRLPEAADSLIAKGLDEGREWGRFDVAIEASHPLLRVVAWSMNRRSRLTGIATGDQAMFVRRRAFDRSGGFPELPLMEDIALSRTLKRMGAPLCLSACATTSGRRWQQRGVLRTIILMWRLRAAYWLGVDAGRLAKAYSSSHGAR
ncbi:MAG: TIGR04283 family arsenosugar biosynthesis glycosyltransferase [Casimicrobiaceae bacterium]